MSHMLDQSYVASGNYQLRVDLMLREGDCALLYLAHRIASKPLAPGTSLMLTGLYIRHALKLVE